ncbi:OLC1v1017131C3 [Oldenlandia corymbosa var. corymbosa]|uniref:Glycosyltransferases n=1 Tax=Oldenlandia corymbosa var. corymbosa TaxID=529605 RepID=A0AAV1E8Q5_OLDCO|nr:OLC1v1017131C3 [Oldenlandia corymbosa var. corymbosa]
MSSPLRTLSPYNDRIHQNGVQSPSQRALSNGKVSSPLSPYIAGVFPSQKNPRKNLVSWKKWFVRCFVFFSLGFLLGMSPFGEVEVVRDFSFEENFVPKKMENVGAEGNEKDVVKSVEDDFVVDKVELGVADSKDVEERFDFVPRKQLIVVTPTFSRPVQGYYLNRLGQVLRLVPPPLLWIVVEMNVASMETADMLRKTRVMYRHLVAVKNLTDVKDRNVHLVNRALEHIEHHKLDGIVYFAGDDSVHSLELFEAIRGISRFGTWPVGILSEYDYKRMLEGPVCNGSQVLGWHTNEKSGRRRFQIDLSGFAFNSTILWDPKRWQRPISEPIRLSDSVKKGFRVCSMFCILSYAP